MPISRRPRSDWLGSSTSPPLMTRSNLSSGPMAARAGMPKPAASAAAPAVPRKSRRDVDMLATHRALRVDVERIDRMARRHEQAVALDAAETQVGGALGQHDLADPLAVRGEYH